MTEKANQPEFIPGLELAEGFFHELVKPILDTHYPGLSYSAALIGTSSEVLGFDTAMSADHHWGPRAMLFLTQDDYRSKRRAIRAKLGEKLPASYRGYSTNFSEPDPEDNNVQIMQSVVSGPVNHRVETYTVNGFFSHYLGIDVEKELQPVDWLTLPHQKLRSIIAGKVFHDDLGLDEIRARFTWYPYDVWLYIMASLWMRISQDEHLMGRAGLAGDENGSIIIGARLVRDIMRLAFLMEKEYPPYAKWLGTAFSRLKSGDRLTPAITDALHAASWQEREDALCRAYQVLAGTHNSLEITEPLPVEVAQFFGRPFRVIWGERFAKAIIRRIQDPQVVPLTGRSLMGSIDIISDNTDFLEDASLRKNLKSLFE